MSVLIKGMKMPQACWCCPITKCEHCMHFYAKSRPINCPLTELPPHGRLIDADALKTKRKWTDDFYETEYVEVADIDDAPTILEAED